MTDWIWHDEPTLPLGQPAKNELEYLVHLAAREWSIAPPILIRGPEDLESRIHWSDTLTPYAHQVQNLITFCRRAPVALIADDVGLGKTISAGLIVSELMARRKIRRVLIACPSLLLEQWSTELRNKFGLSAEYATGANFDELKRSATPIIVTTYDTLRNRLDEIRQGQFDMLVLDEAHKLRNLHGGKQPPQIALAVRNKLAAKAFKFVVMLTATPIQNRLWDLYSLVDVLAVAKGHANPLGSPREFDVDYIADRTSSGRRLNPGNAERFRRILSQYMVRTRRADCRLAFPARQVKRLRLPPTQEELDLISSLKVYARTLNPLQQTSVLQASCSSPQALLAQLENMRQTDFTTRQALRDRALRVQRTSKMQGLVSILRQLANENPVSWRAVIFTLRKETQYAIEKELNAEFGADSVGLIQGGKANENRRTIHRFVENSPRMHVIVSTDAGAEGVNLQAANLVVNFDLPWNPMVVEQRIGRVQRLGSNFKQVVVLNLVLANTFEEAVVLRLSEKLQLVAQSIGDIESVLESIGGGENDESFESTIRKLVMASLEGQDMDAALAARTRSIEEAKVLYEENQRTVEETVGGLDTMHKAGVRPPALSQIERSMPYPEFVEKALRASGAEVTSLPNGLVVKHPGYSAERIHFREEHVDVAPSAYFGNQRISVCAPGEPSFERLVGEWKGGPDTLVCRALNDADEALDAAVRSWLAQFEGSTLDSWFVTDSRDHFVGRFHLQAEAQVAHDRYETIFTTEATSTEAVSLAANLEPDPDRRVTDFALEKALPESKQILKLATESNKDIRAFCTFYIGRRAEELAKADMSGAPHIHRSFTPGLAVQLIGTRGVVFRRVSLTLRYHLGDEAGQADLEMVPATGSILRQPEILTCQVTNRQAPAAHLDRCSVSEKLAMKSILETCALTGLRALPEHLGDCEVTGHRVLLSKLGRSAFSGMLVRQDYLFPSALSGRLGLAAELRICDFTGAMLAPDEVVRSEVSGKIARIDQISTSVESGYRGHLSELATCDCTGATLLPKELATSDYSGRRVRATLLQSSEKPTHRQGAPDELCECSVTGRRLLLDEVERSKVSGRVADKDLMMRSEISGAWALSDEIVTCEVTAKRMLPEESARCAVSGKLVDWNLLESCRQTGELVLPDELEASAVSGRRVRKDLLVASGKPPHKRALPDELVDCEASGLRLLPQETDWSAISEKRVDRALLRPSDSSGRLGLVEEGGCCEVTGRWLLADEMAHSAVSGKLVDKELLEECSYTSLPCLADELGISDVSGQPVRNDILVPSDKSPTKRALAHELVICAISGKRLLPEEVETSSVSLARADVDLMVRSSKSRAWALPSETGTCAVSARRLLLSELGTCHSTGRMVGLDMLGRSSVSGLMVLGALLATCPETNNLALPNEMEMCSLTGKSVIPGVLATSSVSGRRALRRLMKTSVLSGKYMLPDEGERSAKSGGIALRDELVACSWDRKFYLPSEVGTCALTGVVLANEKIGPDGAGLQLRRALDGTGGTPRPPAPLLAHLRGLDPKVLGDLRDLHVLASPDGTVMAFCGAHRSLFGLKTRWIGGYFLLRPEPEILGTIVSGIRKDGKWLPS